MSEIKENTGALSFVEALSSKDVLALLLPRIRIALPQIKDKRKLKQTEELLAALEDLEKVLSFQKSGDQRSPEQGDNLFYFGLPRTTFQIENQFGHYVNSESPWRERWRELRVAVWDAFEKTIPLSVRELLMSWRWTAELVAFRKMQIELTKSRELVKAVERELLAEEQRSQKKGKTVSILDRLRILIWSQATKRDEEVLIALEHERDAIQNLIADRLADCERLAAVTSVGLRTLFVDCGALFSRVFEDCTRAMDKNIITLNEGETKSLEVRIAALKSELDEKLKANTSELKKAKNKKEKLFQMMEGKAAVNLSDAERVFYSEFMCLNAFELEKQDEAYNRWQRAVTQMKRILETTEESFENVEIYARDVDVDGSGRAATSQIRI